MHQLRHPVRQKPSLQILIIQFQNHPDRLHHTAITMASIIFTDHMDLSISLHYILADQSLGHILSLLPILGDQVILQQGLEDPGLSIGILDLARSSVQIGASSGGTSHVYS